MIYVGMTGAKNLMHRQDSLANNLANASTPGFRAEMQAFRAVPVRGDGATKDTLIARAQAAVPVAPAMLAQLASQARNLLGR